MSWDRYAYVRNSPTNFNDPTGHFSCSDGDSPMCDRFSPPTIPSDGSNSSTDSGNNWELIKSNPNYLTYWPWLMFPQNEPCLGDLGCWGGIEYAHFMVRVNGSSFDAVSRDYLTDFAVPFGLNVSSGTPGIYQTGGVEGIVILKDGTRAIYNYGGQGSTAGAGANASVYSGLAINVRNPEDYKGISSSMTISVSIGGEGITVSYFWNGDYAPLSPGIVQGIQIGYAPGAQVSASWSNVIYNMNWSSKSKQ